MEKLPIGKIEYGLAIDVCITVFQLDDVREFYNSLDEKMFRDGIR